jgi:ACS family hexuronate transporter-like MFS transporter
MFPKQAVGSVTGIAGFGGALAGWAMGRFVGGWLNAHADNYLPIFLTAAAMYLVALLVLHLLAPRLEQAPLASAS